MANMRLFIAHSRGMSDEDLETIKADIHATAQDRNPSHKIEVVLGRDDFQKRAVGKGGWDAWTKDVATGSISGEPRFHAIIIPWETSKDENKLAVGKATAQIAFAAHKAGKIVRAFHTRWDPMFKDIDGLNTVNPNDMKKGFVVEVVL